MKEPLSRRSFLGTGAVLALGAARPRLFRRGVHTRRAFDLVIRSGILLDGTGSAGMKADLGILGGRIAVVGSISPEQGTRVINAEGLVVCPGFIDIHTHSDGSILRCPSADSRIRQGVTTEVTGNCGGSVAPRAQPKGERLDVATYMDRVDQAGIVLNHALLLGQGTLRANVLGQADRKPTRKEMAQILRSLEEGLAQGAFGLSTGLEYVPGRFTPTDEIVELARVVARRGGLYSSHIRNEEDQLLEAVDEALEIGRRAGVRVQVSHLKAGGRPNWIKQGPALERLESARTSGVDALADAYPYTAYSTGLTIFLDDWARVGGTGRLLARLKDPEQRGRIRKSLAPRVKSDLGDFDLIVITSLRNDANQRFVGKDMQQIAEAMGVEPDEAMLRLLETERGRVSFIGHGMSEANVERVLRHPMVMIGSDGSSMAPPKDGSRSLPHPRSYGTFPRVLGHYVRKRRLLSLPNAVRKMTSMPADQVGLADRGRIAPTLVADLVLFDPDAVIDNATFADPHRFPTGIRHVLVAGVSVIADGRPTHHRPGGMLRRA